MRPDGSGAIVALRIRAEAALFDLDGVLVDSMPIICEIFKGWARTCALNPAHVVETVHGRPTMQALADLLPAQEVAAHLAYLTAEEIRRSAEMVCLPGAKELVTADDVERGKPAPDCYLLAAERLGVRPASC